jgi:hypothetical protein
VYGALPPASLFGVSVQAVTPVQTAMTVQSCKTVLSVEGLNLPYAYAPFLDATVCICMCQACAVANCFTAGEHAVACHYRLLMVSFLSGWFHLVYLYILSSFSLIDKFNRCLCTGL